MSIHKITATTTALTLWASASNSITVTRADYLQDTQAEIEAAILVDLQTFFDVKQAKADLPSDDPDKTIDPRIGDGEKIRWVDDDLVSRAVVVESLSWPAGEKPNATVRDAE